MDAMGVNLIGNVVLAIIGFSSGIVLTVAIMAFITAIGLVPRLAQKTQTGQHIKLYESSISVGIIFGTMTGLFNMQLPMGVVLVSVFALAIGVFYGALAMSLAEELNVIPILCRRVRIQQGMFYFVLAIAVGKLAGALMYALIPGFHTPGG